MSLLHFLKVAVTLQKKTKLFCFGKIWVQKLRRGLLHGLHYRTSSYLSTRITSVQQQAMLSLFSAKLSALGRSVLALGSIPFSQLEKGEYMYKEQRETYYQGDEIKAMNTSNSKLRPVITTPNRTQIIKKTSKKKKKKK